MHEAIGRRIAVDVQPYSVVEDAGFKNLLGILEPRYTIPSRKFSSTKVIPEMYDATRARVQSELNDVKSVCLTTNIWSAQSTTQSFLSLTVHWISEEYERSAVLRCELLEGLTPQFVWLLL